MTVVALSDVTVPTPLCDAMNVKIIAEKSEKTFAQGGRRKE